MKTAIELIAEERQRQVSVEGYTKEHDLLTHSSSELAMASMCYALDPAWRPSKIAPLGWPWGEKYWKPTPNDRIRELIKAGALIVAEIERLQNIGK